MNDQPDLANVQDSVVGFLGKLKWQPSNLRVQAGDITVEITWPAADAPRPDAAHPGYHATDGHLPGAIAPGGHACDGHDSHEGTDAEAREYLTSPAVGVFYHAKEPGAEPFVAVGSTVEPGQQVGIVEAMKLMIPVDADRAGIVIDVLKANGDPVEYDEPLFALAAMED
jgi:acetyl-CoA carboxylase biotin carboxyl carrier protein